jgi:3-methyladenine DNA glycosylase Tag
MAMKKVQKSKRSATGPVELDKCQIGIRPKNDNAYFEQMTKVVFRSGMKWDVIENKWPGFQKAFSGFFPQKVAQYDIPEIDRLMKDSTIIRNHRKLTATIKNAQEFLTIRNEHGSFRKFLKQSGQDGETALCRTLSKRFSFLGGSTTLFFLRGVGEEMPETLQKWRKNKMRSMSYKI